MLPFLLFIIIIITIFISMWGGGVYTVDGGSMSRGSVSYPDSDHRTMVWVRRLMGSHDNTRTMGINIGS